METAFIKAVSFFVIFSLGMICITEHRQMPEG